MPTAAAVSITLPADAPLRALTDRPALMASAQISGSAEFAECLGFIRRNLHWDVEADVSTLVGDIAAGASGCRRRSNCSGGINNKRAIWR